MLIYGMPGFIAQKHSNHGQDDFATACLSVLSVKHTPAFFNCISRCFSNYTLAATKIPTCREVQPWTINASKSTRRGSLHIK
jgi:hypothetical protein